MFQYALALSKISLGNNRGKYTGTALFGGGSINFNDILSQGLEEKKTLEERLYTGAAPGLGNTSPAMFFVG